MLAPRQHPDTSYDHLFLFLIRVQSTILLYLLAPF
jgi:hypothetical protein